MFDNFQNLIEAWHPKASKAQAILAQDLGYKLNTVRSMYERNTINPRHFNKIIEAAEKRDIAGVNYALLCRLYEVRWKDKAESIVQGEAA